MAVTDAFIALSGTLVTIGVMSDVAMKVRPPRRSSKRRRSKYDLMY